ncbi:V-set and transmembrane domain-containing protein 2A [Collichthys lucidus]|uniref:V-set and transmembrane domain-containing protein 2A n=1 Tax=Collichthys lucidus TaxID=240159 RepID=A0A4U5VIM0_COLLU|nr:V-set and transmembrane domain-containing protein 2A [Collichthys lucidus]
MSSLRISGHFKSALPVAVFRYGRTGQPPGAPFHGRPTNFSVNVGVFKKQNVSMYCQFAGNTASSYLEPNEWYERVPGPSVKEKHAGSSEMEMIPEPDPDDEGTKISTVKVQGNDISHKLQISRVSKSDEGLYECRVTRANYGEIVEYKAQAWLKVNVTARPRRPLPPPKKSSPLHLTDKKPRKSSSSLGQDNMNSDQRVASTSTSHTSSNTAKHNPGSGVDTVVDTLDVSAATQNSLTLPESLPRSAQIHKPQAEFRAQTSSDQNLSTST